MRRMWILLSVGAVLLGLLAPAAYGAKGGIPGPPGSTTTTTTIPGLEDVNHTMCGPVEDVEWGDFDLTIGYDNGACVDVMADEGPWTIDIAVDAGTLREILLVPRDSVAAGDSCGGYRLRSYDLGDQQLVLPGPDHPSDIDGDERIEAAFINSCGTDFPEYLPEGVDTSLCADFDGTYCHSMEPDIPSPLVLQVFARGSKDMSVTLHVDVPDYTGAPLP